MIYYKPEEIFTIFDSENFDRYLIYYVSYNIPYKSRDTYHTVRKILKQSRNEFASFRMVKLTNIKNMSSPIYKK